MGSLTHSPCTGMGENFVIFPKAERSFTTETRTVLKTRKSQTEQFSVATRRLPLLGFLIFMGAAVLVAGALAHQRSNWQSFWNQEAVVERKRVLSLIPLGPLLDSLTTGINRIFVKGGWIVAGTLIILVQAYYLLLVMIKRDRTPALEFLRNFKLTEMISIEIGVLLLGTAFFLFSTKSFNWIGYRVGSCTLSDGTFEFPISKAACRGSFRNFDISGHCFLIVHSCLLAMEYASKLVFVWRAREQVTSSIENEEKESDIESLSDQFSLNSDLKSNDTFNRNYHLLRGLLVSLLIAVFLLCFTEFLVFLQTILFYHTVLEKILGTFIGSWYWISLHLLSLKYPHLF